MRLAGVESVSGARVRGLKPLPRGRAIVARATVEGDASDVLGNFLESLNPVTPSAPVAAPEAPAAAVTPTPPAPTPAPPPPAAAAPPPAPAPAPSPVPAPPAVPVPTPEPVAPSNPELPSIESLAQRVEYPSSKVPAPAPAKAADFNPLQPLVDALTSAEEAVENAFDDTAGAIIDNFTSFALPSALQEKLTTINERYSTTKEAFDEAPEVYLFFFLLVCGAIGYTYYRNEFGGFSGIYKPTDLVESLTKEDNILLVDIRSEEEQEEQGVLDLRRSARTKAVSLPIVEVPDAVKGDVRNQRILQRKLSAALVCSLANVNAFTKIVLMDTRGGTTKPLAREICSQGYRAFILKGGYTLWSRVGLATKKGSYEVTAADLLADKREELGEAATSTAEQLKKPQTAALALLILGAVGTTIAYPHESFQFIGFTALQITVIVKLLSYNRPIDALAALNQSTRSFAENVGSAATKASDAGSQFKKLSGSAAAASAAVASAASKASTAASDAASKNGSSVEDDKVSEATPPAPVKDVPSEDEEPPKSGSMFVKASADKPAPVIQTSNTPPPSKPSAEPVAAKEEKPAPAKTENALDALARAAREAPANPSPSAQSTSGKTSVSKLETLGKEGPEPEASKPAPASKPQASTPTAPKLEAAKPETSTPAPKKPDFSKVSASKSEPAKADASKVEAKKPEPTKVEASKAEPTKVEASKAEPAKVEPAKVQASKAEPKKQEPSLPAVSKPATAVFSALKKDAPAKTDKSAQKDKPVSSKPVSSAGVGFGAKKAPGKKEKKEKWPDAVAEAAAEAAAIAQDVPKPVVEIVDDKKKSDVEKIGNGSTKVDVKSANGNSAGDKKSKA